MPIPVDRSGNPVPIFYPDTSKAVDIDGTNNHAESNALEEGKYRLAVVSSVSQLGVRIDIGLSPTAVASLGAWIGDGQIEYFYIKVQEKISVLAGILNITRLE